MAELTSSEPLAIALSPAQPDDLAAVKAVADRHRTELGFILRPVIQASIQEGALWVARAGEGGEIVGFVRFHHRLDKVTTIYDICVSHAARGRGVGRKLIAAVRAQALMAHHHALVLKAPEELPANDFYRALGFVDRGLERGRKRRLRTWMLPLDELVSR
jgi:ribosomal protein S18 acetylase RimI-like enzyme